MHKKRILAFQNQRFLLFNRIATILSISNLLFSEKEESEEASEGLTKKNKPHGESR